MPQLTPDKFVLRISLSCPWGVGPSDSSITGKTISSSSGQKFVSTDRAIDLLRAKDLRARNLIIFR